MDFWEWYEKNKWRLFWFKYRMLMGLDPKGQDTLARERRHFSRMDALRQNAINADNPRDAIYRAPMYDKQVFLSQWWEYMSHRDRRKYLLHVWSNKLDACFLGFDWWLPFFNDIGFITNCDAAKPTKPIMLYRGTEPFFMDSICWTDDLELAQDFTSIPLLLDSRFVYETIVYPYQILGILDEKPVDVNGKPYDSGLTYILDHRTIEDAEVSAWVKH